MSRRNTLLETIKEGMKDIELDNSKIKNEFFVTLKSELDNLSDSRYQPNTRHIFSEVIAIVLFGVIASCDTWEEIEDFATGRKKQLKKFLTLPSGVPSRDTLKRCCKILKEEELETIMINIVNDIMNRFYRQIGRGSYINDDYHIEDILAMDGKEENGSGKRNSKNGKIKNLQLLNVYSTEYGLCLTSHPIDNKTNEIPVGQEIISHLNLRNKVLTVDALNTQKELTKIVIKGAKGHYCFPIKENHKDFYEDLKRYFDDEIMDDCKNGVSKNSYHFSYSCRLDKNESSVIKREYYSSDETYWYRDINLWEGVASFNMEKVIVEDLITGEKRTTYRYFIASFYDNDLFARSARQHWRIENNCHWHMDYTFSSDDNSTSDKESARALVTIKHFALALLQIVQPFYGKNVSLKRIRKMIFLLPSGLDTMFKHLSKAYHLI